VAAVVAVAVPATAAVAAETPVPPLRLIAAKSTVTVEHWPGDNRFHLNLATHVVAGSAPFEVRLRRASYQDPIVAHQVVRASRPVRLPDGLVSDFTGFPDFTHVTIADESGTVVHERDDDFCPNTYGTTRNRPEAPATTPYPYACPAAPYTLGSVWGIQSGWSAQTTAEMTAADFLELPDGTYTATVRVNEPYRSLFGMPPASVTVTLVVRAAASASAALRGHSEHSVHPGHSGFTPAARWIRPFTDERGRDQLAFGATVWNAGTSSLVVDGFRRPGEDVMDAYQYFFDTKGNQVGYAPAGTMEWDARDGHYHWHFTAFAQYRLLNADRTVALRSGKEAFCLVNTDAVDYTVANAVWRPGNTSLGTSCGSQSSAGVRQVLDIGNGDTYTQDLPGQSFDITDLPNGTYHIEVAANPENRLQESNTANNVAHRTVTLGGEPGNRTATVPPFPGLDG
jgi:hypothetical protein